MSIRKIATISILLIVSLAGCMINVETHATDPDPDGLPAAPGGARPPPQQESVPAPIDSSSNASTPRPDWPSPEEATIRPGVNVNNCTSNFVFSSIDYNEVYIGSAAHCFTYIEEESSSILGSSTNLCYNIPFEPGIAISIEGASEDGILVYSSYFTMHQNNDYENETLCEQNDFALIKISDRDKSKVNPALSHFGGPIELANSSSIQVYDKVLSFGNSTYHHDIAYLQRREGYVLRGQANYGWTTEAEFITPAIPGDSGSAVVDGSGRAVGVLSSIVITTDPSHRGTHWVTNLDKALSYAREHAGIEVRLATWDLLEEGMLPDPPNISSTSR